MAFPIDHLFTVTTDREAARTALAGMGFELTERGEHPGRGTSNHVMFFGRCYWELLAIDQPGPASALLGKATTLMGCALRTGDAARDAAAAARLGASAGATEPLTRPVRVDGQWHTARFTIAPLAPAAPADVYFFFCQHLTPELVWPHERVVHPNGAFRLKALYAVGPSGSSAERSKEPPSGSSQPLSASAPPSCGLSLRKRCSCRSRSDSAKPSGSWAWRAWSQVFRNSLTFCSRAFSRKAASSKRPSR